MRAFFQWLWALVCLVPCATRGQSPDAVAVVVGNEYLLGYWTGSQWLSQAEYEAQADPDSELEAEDDGYWTIYWYGKSQPLGFAEVNPREEAGDGDDADKPCGGLPFSLETVPADAVGIGADDNALPRPIIWDASPNPAIQQALANLLANKGLDSAEATVDQLVRVDLEGDGNLDLVISSSGTEDETLDGMTRHWSVVALARREGSAWRLIPLREVYFQADLPADAQTSLIPEMATSYLISHVLDVTGDGTYELIVRETGVESEGYLVLQAETRTLSYEVAVRTMCTD